MKTQTLLALALALGFACSANAAADIKVTVKTKSKDAKGKEELLGVAQAITANGRPLEISIPEEKTVPVAEGGTGKPILVGVTLAIQAEVKGKDIHFTGHYTFREYTGEVSQAGIKNVGFVTREAFLSGAVARGQPKTIKLSDAKGRKLELELTLDQVNGKGEPIR